MRGSGYAEQATNEVCQALAVLAKYGVLGSNVGFSHSTNGTHHAQPISYLGVSALEHQVSAGNVFGAIGQVNLESYMGATSPTPRASLERYETAAFDPFRHTGQQAATPISLNNNSFGLATSNVTAQQINATIQASAAAAAQLSVLKGNDVTADVKSKKEVEIPEVIVGAILGKQFYYF